MYICIISIVKFRAILLVKSELNNVLVLRNPSLHLIKVHKGNQKCDLPWCLENSQEANTDFSAPTKQRLYWFPKKAN